MDRLKYPIVFIKSKLVCIRKKERSVAILSFALLCIAVGCGGDIQAEIQKTEEALLGGNRNVACALVGEIWGDTLPEKFTEDVMQMALVDGAVVGAEASGQPLVDNLLGQVGVDIVYDLWNHNIMVTMYQGYHLFGYLGAHIAVYKGIAFGLDDHIYNYSGRFDTLSVTAGIPFLTLGALPDITLAGFVSSGMWPPEGVYGATLGAEYDVSLNETMTSFVGLPVTPTVTTGTWVVWNLANDALHNMLMLAGVKHDFIHDPNWDVGEDGIPDNYISIKQPDESHTRSGWRMSQAMCSINLSWCNWKWRLLPIALGVIHDNNLSIEEMCPGRVESTE